MMSVERAVAPEQKLRVVEEILKSRTFSRSDQLQRFLRYIADKELSGRGEEITEYSIATEALLRPSDYSPGDDSAVRGRAHALRHKLHEYYEVENPEAELRVELPKGSYRPLFVHRVKPAPSLPLSAPAPPLRTSVLTPFRSFLGGVLLTLACTAVALFSFHTPRSPRIDPLMSKFWGPLLVSPAHVTVMVGSPPVAGLLPSSPTSPPIGGNMFPAVDTLAKWYASLNLADRGGAIYTFPSRGYWLSGDALAAIAANQLISSSGVSSQVVPESSASPMTLQESGLVIIGSPTYSPYVARVLRATPLSIRFDPGLNEEVISDSTPGANPRQIFVPKRNKNSYFTNVYGLITVLPSQPGRVKPERIIIFSGITGSQGAHAAAEFFTSLAGLKELDRRLTNNGTTRLPPAYQVVVRSGMEGFAAINAVYETHRIIDPPPVIE